MLPRRYLFLSMVRDASMHMKKSMHEVGDNCETLVAYVYTYIILGTPDKFATRYYTEYSRAKERENSNFRE